MSSRSKSSQPEDLATESLKYQDSLGLTTPSYPRDICSWINPDTPFEDFDGVYSDNQLSWSLPSDSFLDTHSTPPYSSIESRRQHICAQCGWRTNTSAEMQEHGRKEGHKPFICTEFGCNKAYTRSDVFVRHRSVHGEGVFKCRKCEWSFKRRDHLVSHVKKKHGGPSSISSDSSSRKSSMTSSTIFEVQRALPDSSLRSIPEKSGLKCVAGTLRHIVKDDGQLAHVGDMIDDLDSNGTKDLAMALAWTMLTYPSTKSLASCLVLEDRAV